MKTTGLLVFLSGAISMAAVLFPDSRSDKMALIIAVGQYPAGSGWDQLSSENDIRILKETLLSQGFSEEAIFILKDEQATRSGILSGIRQHLVNKVKKGGQAVFHFSGHGQQIQDDNRDEIDGFDEAIVPYDSPLHYQRGIYEGQNLIRDDELGVLLKDVRQKLGKNGHLLVNIDACHSGTATRGLVKARGTEEQMASPEYILQNKARPNDANTLAAEAPDVEGAAPVVAFFSSGAGQMSLECTGDDGESYGSLSYAFSKAFSTTNQLTSYRDLFEHIRLEMSTRSPRQTPQTEGDLDETVLGGKLTGRPAWFSVEEMLDQRSLTLKAGMLSGVFENTMIAFYPPGTIDTASARPVVLGKVVHAELLECDVELNAPLSRKEVIKLRGFIQAKNYGPLSAAVRLDLPEGGLKEALLKIAGEIPAIHFVETNPELLIEMSGENEPRLRLLTKDEYLLLDTIVISNRGDFRHQVSAVKHALIEFAQAKFLRPIELVDSRLNIALEFLTPEGEPIRLEEKRGFQVGDKVHLRIRNTGLEPFYFNLIDIQPDYKWTLVIPFGKPASDYYLLPDTHYDFDTIVNIKEPIGTDVLKLIASEQPLDLSNVMNTRGNEGGGNHPFEVLFQETYLNDNKRGGTTSSLPGGGLAVRSVVVEIWK